MLRKFNPYLIGWRFVRIRLGQRVSAGLGLPLTNSLVELHGGSLNLDSQIGVGTTVAVRLPASRIVSSTENMDPLELEFGGAA